MTEPAEVPESTEMGFVLSIEEFDNGFVAHGLMGLVATDKTRGGAIEKLRKLTIRQVDGPEHKSGLLAASPVAGAGSNYIADREQAPQWVAFTNGRTVGIAFPEGQEPHLVIGWEQPGERRLRYLAAAENDAGCVNIGDPSEAVDVLKLAQPSAEGDGWIAVTDRRSLEIETGKQYWVWGPAFRVPRKDHLIYGGNGPQWQYFANSAVTHCRPVVIPAPPAPPVAKEGRES